MLSASNQAYVFLSTVYAGFIIGIIYDFYRMARKIVKPGYFITGVSDLIFWLCIGVFSFLVLFKVNNGEVRLYNIAGLAIGWSLYALILSPYVMKVLKFCYNILAKVTGFVVGIILWPFKQLARFFKYIAGLVKGIKVKPLCSLINKLRKNNKK